VPNHCSNILLVSGPEVALNRFKYTALKYSTEDQIINTHLDLEELAPLPPIEDDEGGHSIQVTTDAWGTKWNTYGNSIGITDNPKNELLIYFRTAWSPPIHAIISGSKLFPKLDFVSIYYESGMAFAGIIHINNGEIIDEVTHQGDEAAEKFFEFMDPEYPNFEEMDQIDAWWELYGSSIELKRKLIRILWPSGPRQWNSEPPPITSIYRQYSEVLSR